MLLDRQGREFYRLAIDEVDSDGTPIAAASWEASFDNGSTWAACSVVTIQSVVYSEWLVAGPDADATGAVAVVAGAVEPKVRAIDNPQIIIRGTERIKLTGSSASLPQLAAGPFVSAIEGETGNVTLTDVPTFIALDARVDSLELNGGGGSGATILSGTTVPGSGLGADGDFYLRTTTSDLYGPKAAGAWGSPVSLIGPAGAAGPAVMVTDNGDGSQTITVDNTNFTLVDNGDGTYSLTLAGTTATLHNGLPGAPGAAGANGSNGAISQLQDEGSNLTVRPTINFVGAGVTATDDAANSRTLVTIPGGGGGTLTDDSNGHITESMMGMDSRHFALYRRTGAIAETLPRIGYTVAYQTITSGRMQLMGLPLLKGQVVNTITFMSGSTGATSPTNQWFALYSPALALLGVTNDATTGAWAAATEKTLTLASPVTISADGLYYIACMVAATTPNTLWGMNGVNSAYTGLAPIISGHDAAHAGLTTPAGAPATATLTAGIIWPYAWVA